MLPEEPMELMKTGSRRGSPLNFLTRVSILNSIALDLNTLSDLDAAEKKIRKSYRKLFIVVLWPQKSKMLNS